MYQQTSALVHEVYKQVSPIPRLSPQLGMSQLPPSFPSHFHAACKGGGLGVGALGWEPWGGGLGVGALGWGPWGGSLRVGALGWEPWGGGLGGGDLRTKLKPNGIHS